jgi:hypothetical protein
MAPPRGTRTHTAGQSVRHPVHPCKYSSRTSTNRGIPYLLPGQARRVYERCSLASTRKGEPWFFFFFWMTAPPPPTTVLIGTNLQLCTEFVTMWRVWPELSLLSRRERGGSSFPPIRFFRVVSVPRFTARLAIWSKVVRQRRRPNNNKAQSWESIWLARITLFCCNSIRSSTECVGSGVHFSLLCFSKAWTGWVDRFSSSPSLLSSDGGTRDRSPLAPT